MIKNFILIFLGISFIYPQCQDNEVEIWSTCYSIENTIALHNSENTFGEIPVTVCDLVNLEILDLGCLPDWRWLIKANYKRVLKTPSQYPNYIIKILKRIIYKVKDVFTIL